MPFSTDQLQASAPDCKCFTAPCCFQMLTEVCLSPTLNHLTGSTFNYVAPPFLGCSRLWGLFCGKLNFYNPEDTIIRQKYTGISYSFEHLVDT